MGSVNNRLNRVSSKATTDEGNETKGERGDRYRNK